jgi:nitroreductase
MIENPTLEAIRRRRSVHRFVSDPIGDEQLEAILEAGRWAPSALNSQPWDFVVVTDPQIRSQIGTILEQITLSWRGFAEAPAMIVVAVSLLRDANHYVEDGAIAAQNICLAAHSMGLASSWAGVYAKNARKGVAEKALKKLLALPETHRVIAVIPIGTAAQVGRSARRPLAEIVHRDRFHPMPEAGPEASTMRPR